MNRLLSVLQRADGVEPYGIGVDEDMSVAIVDGRYCEVLGPAAGSVILLERVISDGRSSSSTSSTSSSSSSHNKFFLTVLKNGDKFEIEKL